MKVMFGNKGVNTGASATQEAQVLPAFLQSHGSSIQGCFAVDGGDTALLGTSLAKYNLVGKVHAGGFDLEPQTLTAISAGQIDFTVDQSPYLQGFLPTLYMYLWQLSGGLVAPPETNTGLKFVVKGNVGAYTAQTTRFEGSTKSRSTSSTPGRSRPDRLSARHWVVQARGGSPAAKAAVSRHGTWV